MRPAARGDAGLMRHAGAAGAQQRQQTEREGEVAEVIGAELQLEPVLVVCRSGGVMTPALLIRMSIGPALCGRACRRAPPRSPARTGRAARVETFAPGRPTRICSAAFSPLAGVRTGITTSAPARARRVAMTRPMPSLAPVTTASFPARSGIVDVGWCETWGSSSSVGGGAAVQDHAHVAIRRRHSVPVDPLTADPPLGDAVRRGSARR